MTISVNTSNAFSYKYPKFTSAERLSLATGGHTHNYSWTENKGNGKTGTASTTTSIKYLQEVNDYWPTASDAVGNTYVTGINFS